MKKFIYFFIAMLLPVMCLAEIRDLTPQEAATTNVWAKQLANELRDAVHDTENTDWFQDPDCNDFVQRAKQFLKQDEYSLKLGYFGDKIREKLFNDFMAMMEQKSRETGREIKHDFYNDGNGFMRSEYWLDRGKMDSAECNWDFKKRQACDYPDGFENFSLTLDEWDTDDNDRQWNTDLYVSFDNKAENKTNYIQISMFSNGDKTEDQRTFSLYVWVDGHESKYDEWYAWRNQEAEDVRNGMFIRPPRKQRREERKKNKGFPFGIIAWEMDTSRKWKSQDLPPVALFGLTMDASVMESKFSDHKNINDNLSNYIADADIDD